jgi:hypothetical protein
MNWIKDKLDAQAKADKEREEKRKNDELAEARTIKALSKATNEAFAELSAAIRADVELLNTEKKGAERFSADQTIELHSNSTKLALCRKRD